MNTKTFRNEPTLTLLRQYGEDTAYSSKGHFKSAEFIRFRRRALLIINLILAILTIIDVLPPGIWPKLLSALALCVSIFLLVSDLEKEPEEFRAHHRFGNDYLALHKEIAHAFYMVADGGPTMSPQEILKKINGLNSDIKRPPISFIGRRLSKFAIEYTKEMQPWWRS